MLQHITAVEFWASKPIFNQAGCLCAKAKHFLHWQIYEISRLASHPCNLPTCGNTHSTCIAYWWVHSYNIRVRRLCVYLQDVRPADACILYTHICTWPCTVYVHVHTLDNLIAFCDMYIYRTLLHVIISMQHPLRQNAIIATI